MSTSDLMLLTEQDFKKIASPYLGEGRKQESWQFGDIEIRQRQVRTTVSMTSFYQSPTDQARFHLSFVTALEFLSQLMIIYVHAWAGLEEKSREGWMLESQFRSVNAIRNPQAMQVDMQVKSMRRLGESLFCVAEFAVTDDQGGLFDVRLKGMVS